MDETSVLASLWSVLTKILTVELFLTVLGIMISTQFVKIATIQLTGEKATHREIFFTTVACSMGFGWFLSPSPDIAMKITAIFLGWGISWFLAAYGLNLLSAYFPKLFLALQIGKERRKKSIEPVDERRKEPPISPTASEVKP